MNTRRNFLRSVVGALAGLPFIGPLVGNAETAGPLLAKAETTSEPCVLRSISCVLRRLGPGAYRAWLQSWDAEKLCWDDDEIATMHDCDEIDEPLPVRDGATGVAWFNPKMKPYEIISVSI